MNKKRRWFFALLLALVMCLGVSVSVWAETEGDYEYSVDSESGTATITNYNGDGGDISIPSTLGGYSVTGIGTNAFRDCSGLTSVSIPDSVTTIGGHAFDGCSSLTSVNISASVTSIEYYAFKACSSLQSIDIPASVTSMEEGIFEECSSLVSASIQNGVTEIPDRTFRYCESLTSLSIPASVSSIGDDAFEYCYSLVSIEVNSGNSVYSSLDGVLFNKDQTTLVRYPAGKTDEEYVIPEGVTDIESGTFSGCKNLKSISTPKSMTYIGGFSDCSSLESISVSEGAASIGYGAFWGCGDLKSISIPEGVSSIGEKAFYECYSLVSVSIPKSVISIGESAFHECRFLASVSIPENVTSIEAATFYGCSSLTRVDIPEGVTSIGSGAFSECSSLASVNIPEGVTSIGGSAFSECSRLTSVDIPEGVTSIGGYAFYNCSSLASVNIPEGVSSIGEKMFYGCNGLGSVSIPKSVTSIGYYAFYECSSLTNLTIPEGVTSIGNHAFDDCGLSSLTISKSVTSIGDLAFFDCSSLTSVIIPESVTSIGDYAFGDCDRLISVTVLGDNVEIGYKAFGFSVNDLVEGFVLYANSGSTAETYAKENDITFQVLSTHTHSYTSEVTTAAGCITAGTETYTCSICGDTYTKEIPATGHSYNSGKVTTEATCTEAGVKTYTCETCKTTYTESIPATDHNYQNGVCTICGAKEKETETKDALAAPVISSVANSEKGVTVTWGAISGATQYRVYYKGGSVKNWTKVKDTADTSCTVTGLTSGKTYSFTVQCISPSESSYDATGTSIKYLSAGTISSLTNTAKGVKVKWTKVTGAKGYYVYRKLGSGSWKKVKTVKKNSTTSYTDTGVKSKNGKTCTYKVIPYSGSTKAAFVTSKTVRLTGVSISSLTNVKTKKLKVKWKKDSKVTGYEIQYSLKSGFSSAKTVKVKKKATTSTSISRLTKGKKYYVRIRTYKSVSGAKYYSAWSGKKSVKIKK